MTNFSRIEFDRVGNTVQDYVLINWKVGRGRKSKFYGKDVFFMLLTPLKRMRENGTTWEECSELRDPCFNVS